MSAIKVSELEGYQRIDAEYYQPGYFRLLQSLDAAKAQPLKQFAKSAKRKFTPTLGQLFNYIEISEVDLATGRVNAVEMTGEEAPSRAQFVVKAGDVIISAVRPARSAVALITEKQSGFVCSSGFVVLHPNKIAPEFLFASLKARHVSTLLGRRTTATMYPTVSEADVLDIPILIPSPEVISRTAERVAEAAKKEEEAILLYAQAHALLTAELRLDKLDLSESLYSVRRASAVQESHRADAEYYKRKYLNLLRYLDEQPHASLEELATFSGGATPLGAEYLEEGIPFLRIQNVGENRLVMDDVVYIDEEIHAGLLKRSQLKPRDVLITITGRIGTSAVVPDDLRQANINQHIVRMRLKSGGMNPYYLAAFLNSVGGKLQTERESYGTTRDALPYYCLARIRVLKADADLQKEIENTICKAEETDRAAKCLLVEAKAEVERMIEQA